jgi:hypothetical protein
MAVDNQSSSFSMVTKVLTAHISSQSDSLQVSCTALSGTLVEDCRFPMEASILELEAYMRRKETDGKDFLVAVTFLCCNRGEVNKGDLLKDYATICMQMDILNINDFISAFNVCASPKAVLHVMQDAGMSPQAAGNLLYRAGGELSVQLLGECLGNHGDFWKQVALSYPENFTNFAGMGIVEAIRAYLWCFRLPGEAAQIERIVEGFARSFYLHNTSNHKDGKQYVITESDSDDDVAQGECTPNAKHSCWDSEAMGWYVCQPLSGPNSLPCCVHCGRLDGDLGELYACKGCNVVHFCRRCRTKASRYGHAVVGMIGYGRACVAAKKAAGCLEPENQITFQRDVSGWVQVETSTVSERSLRWEPASPFKTEDSVMVLAYAIIMLTTNLHSANVKDKMKKHEFIRQNNEVNGGSNFPGDFLAKIYDDIKKEELKVMRHE